MIMRTKVWLVYGAIVLLTSFALVVVVPNGPNLNLFGIQREIKVNLGLDLQGGTSLTYDADTTQIPAGGEEDAIGGVRDVIERRINAYGVSEPVIQTSHVGESWRVLVELPGVTDVQEAISLIGETPLLEFRKEAAPVEKTQEEQAAVDQQIADAKAKAEDLLAKAKAPDADFATLAKENSEDPGSAEQGGDLDFFGPGVMVTEFEDAVYNASVGELIPELVETSFGFHVITVTDERTLDDGTVERRASHILIQKPYDATALGIPNYENTELSGKNLKRATVQFDQANQPTVGLEFDEAGAKLFETLTGENVGKTIAIYLDGSPITVPRVNQAISGGQAVITGSFTLEEARTLAQRLNAGALPVPIELVSQQRVGPSLGRLSVQASLVAGMLSMLIVSLFMIANYRFHGVIASVALLIYALLVLALFKLIPVTLTLAGVAGFILSIGMAVDANVLIFERMREERRRGASQRVATEEGFRRAWLSIRDSNVSSLITCAILAWFGSSIIVGFAITLALGILISMFTAITVTRTFLRLGYVGFRRRNVS